tara:strand:+ start:221 stop:952 length:732 start_codon:yes stop_codon:yes gene_type:complete
MQVIADPVFQRARQAQETTLRQTAEKFISKLGKGKYSSLRGLDGRQLCEKWEVELKWDGRAGRAYKTGAAPRGRQAVLNHDNSNSEDDEYSSSGEGQALAEAAGVGIWAVTRRKADAATQCDVQPDAAKCKRPLGAKKRLQQALGCEVVYRCALCRHPMRAARQVSSLAEHRMGKSSCVRAVANRRSTNGGGTRGPPCPGSLAAIEARLDSLLSPEALAAVYESRAADAIAGGYRNIYRSLAE